MIYKKLIFLLIIYGVSFSYAQPAFSINIIAPQILLDTSITAITIKDVCQLLQQACNCSVTINEKPREVNILLPFVNDSTASAPTRFSSAARYPYRHYPSHHYEWSHDKDKKGRYHLVLQASSFQGVSFGLYGLLQEQLGFKFVHPRQTIIPHWNEWPLKKDFYWKAEPLFDKKGFHLHTQHPIELTEPLLDENFPNALEQIKEYINWLVRNGQNYFEFCLLNSVKKKTWIHHARAIT
ncbi:MAG: hypothetical protein NZ522_05155, partial [Chitinophagales bacterium]|nr:hypothetical protein [Chitinophagales bacterium]